MNNSDALKTQTKTALKSHADALGVSTKGMTKPQLIEAILGNLKAEEPAPSEKHQEEAPAPEEEWEPVELAESVYQVTLDAIGPYKVTARSPGQAFEVFKKTYGIIKTVHKPEILKLKG